MFCFDCKTRHNKPRKKILGNWVIKVQINDPIFGSLPVFLNYPAPAVDPDVDEPEVEQTTANIVEVEPSTSSFAAPAAEEVSRFFKSNLTTFPIFTHIMYWFFNRVDLLTKTQMKTIRKNKCLYKPSDTKYWQKALQV